MACSHQGKMYNNLTPKKLRELQYSFQTLYYKTAWRKFSNKKTIHNKLSKIRNQTLYLSEVK